MEVHGLEKLRQVANEFKRLETVLPTKLGNIAVNFYKGSFDRQGWIDSNRVTKWKPKKIFPDGRKRKFKPGAILVKSGRLRRSIRITLKGYDYVAIGTDVPYARAHNEGEKINQSITITPKMRRFFWAMFYNTGDLKWKYAALRRKPIERTIDMPMRQFMGLSDFLERRLEKNMEYEIEQIFNKVLR